MNDRNELVERVNAAVEAERLPDIVSQLLTDFEGMEDSEVHETLMFIQSQVEQGDISENPFHLLMSDLGENDELFQRMAKYVAAEALEETEEPETTADEN